MERLCIRQWPSNVRDLRTELEQAITVADGPPGVSLALDTCVSAVGDAGSPYQDVPAPSGQQAAFTNRPAALAARLGRSPITTGELTRLLQEHRFNKSAVARKLGVSRSTLHRWINRAGVR
jgi:transcriptional regulator of acetoin/glycerol metabolism